MWAEAIGVAGAAVTAGMLTIPAVRRLSFGSISHDWLCHELDFDRIEDDGCTIRFKSDLYARVYKLDGDTYDTKSEDAQKVLCKQRQSFYLQIAKLGIPFRLFGIKREKQVNFPAKWPSPILQKLGDAEADLFKKSYEIGWYLVIQHQKRQVLGEAESKLFHMLDRFGPKRLAIPEIKDAPCELTGFINFLICGDLRKDLTVVSKDISANVPACDLIFERDGGFVRQLPKKTFARTIMVHKWPEMVTGKLTHELMCLQGEIEISQIIIPTSKEIALGLYHQEASVSLGLADKAMEAQAMMEMLKKDEASALRSQFSVTIQATTENEVTNLVDKACKIMSDLDIFYTMATKTTPFAWFNRHPGRDKLIRPLRHREDLPAALWPWELSPIGMTTSLYGDAPVRFFRTPSGQPYNFQYQNSTDSTALGHYAVIAASRSGKSVLMTWLLGGISKFPGVVGILLDSHEGSRFMVEVMGGIYYAFDKLSLNPLDCEDTPRNRQQIRKLMKMMLGELGEDLESDKMIDHAINFAFRLPRGKQRTFNEVYPMAFKPGTPQALAFAKWVVTPQGHKGAYSHIFNAETDGLMDLISGAFLVGINMNEVLEDKALAGPVVTYINQIILRLARSGRIKGFNLLIEECANLLSNQEFRKFAQVGFREYGKFKGAVGMVFQDPKALIDSGIAETVTVNTSTYVFFPVPGCDTKSYEPFNLTPEQLDFVRGYGVTGRKVLVVKKDAATGFNESVILDVDLSPIDPTMKYFQSGPAPIKQMETLQEEWGAAWPQHV